MSKETGKAAARYNELLTYRDAYQRAAYDSAALTIPALVPRVSDSPGQDDRTRATLPVPSQSLGSRGVNNLGAKMLLALFPPNSPLFRYVIDAKVKTESEAEELQQVQELLSERESIIMADIESSKYRPKLVEAFKQLIVAGNVLLLLTKATMRVFRMDRYVIKRGPMGQVVEIVVRESLDKGNLPPRIKKIVEKQTYNDIDAKDDDDVIELYTHIKREGDRYVEYQECLGEEVPDTKGSFPVESPRWLPLSFVRCDGEDYGRGYVEEYIGDLTTYNALQKAIREDAAIAAHTIFTVDPNAPPGLERQMSEAPNGGYVRADAGMIIASRTDKSGDMQIAYGTAEQLKSDLSFAFLLNSAIQRNAERVTAQEIREVSRELEATQGGVFSVLSEELILPVVTAHERDLEKEGKIPPLPPGLVKPAIVTGLDAIGRSADLVRLTGALQDIGMLSQMDPRVPGYLDSYGVMLEILQGHSIVPEGIVKSKQEVEEEMAAAQQQEQQAQMQEAGLNMVEKAGPELVKQAGGAMLGGE